MNKRDKLILLIVVLLITAITILSAFITPKWLAPGVVTKFTRTLQQTFPFLASKTTPPTTEKYLVSNEVSGYTLELQNIDFLDQLTSDWKVFDVGGIFSPEKLSSLNPVLANEWHQHRTTINSIKFILTESVTGKSYSVYTYHSPDQGPVDWGQWESSLNNGILEIKIAIAPEFVRQAFIDNNTISEKFSLVGLQALYLHTPEGLENQLRSTNSIPNITKYPSTSRTISNHQLILSLLKETKTKSVNYKPFLITQTD